MCALSSSYNIKHITSSIQHSTYNIQHTQITILKDREKQSFIKAQQDKKDSLAAQAQEFNSIIHRLHTKQGKQLEEITDETKGVICALTAAHERECQLMNMKLEEALLIAKHHQTQMDKVIEWSLCCLSLGCFLCAEDAVSMSLRVSLFIGTFCMIARIAHAPYMITSYRRAIHRTS